MSITAQTELIQLAKYDGLHTDKPVPNTALMRSWQRSREALGEPSNVTDVPQVSIDALDPHLLEILRPPLNAFAENIEGTGLGILLADAQGRILERWCNDRTASAHLDTCGSVRGAVLAEDVVGTNGVGTVVSTGESVQISGVEHFADFYSKAVCSGTPVRHPVNGNLLAVVTLSSNLTPRADLLLPLLKTVTAQLEQCIMDSELPATRHMMELFAGFSRQRQAPVVAFGPNGMVMQNRIAATLQPGDVTRLRTLSADSPDQSERVIELSSGKTLAHVTAIDGDHTIITLSEPQRTHRTVIAPPTRAPLIGRSAAWLDSVNRAARYRDTRSVTIIAGEPGTGKTSLALGIPFTPGMAYAEQRVVDAAEQHVLGSRKWLKKIARLHSDGELKVVRGIESLSAETRAGLRSVLETTPSSTGLFLTTCTTDREALEALELQFATTTITTPPLRERSADVAELWRFFITSTQATEFGANPATIESLTAYSWPGNMRELRTLVEQITLSGKSGPVLPQDLPESFRSGRPLGLIETVELSAIKRALAEAEGNRAKAATILGVSRATVYRKMKSYGLLSR